MSRLLPTDVIIAAVNGDAIALQSVIAFYNRYILKLSARGDSVCIDTELKNRLEAKLMDRVLKFKL
jgi:hypothetical protein